MVHPETNLSVPTRLMTCRDRNEMRAGRAWKPKKAVSGIALRPLFLRKSRNARYL
jgi:hypothetical protein